MSFRIAFAGASGTGKTTLARFALELLREQTFETIELAPSHSRELAAKMGFASPYDVDAAGKRFEFQQRLYEEKIAWESARENFVADRTFADLLAYSALHLGGELPETFYQAHVAAMPRYTHVFYCDYEAFCDLGSDAQRKTNLAYHRFTDFLIWEILDIFPKPNLTSLWMPDLDKRKSAIRSAIFGA